MVYSPVTSEFRVDTETTPGNQASVKLTRLPGGLFAATWSTLATSSQNAATFVQLVDSAGNKVGPETVIEMGAWDLVGGSQSRRVVAALAGGGVVLVWRGVAGNAGV